MAVLQHSRATFPVSNQQTCGNTSSMGTQRKSGLVSNETNHKELPGRVEFRLEMYLNKKMLEKKGL